MMPVSGYPTKKSLKSTVGLHPMTVLVETSAFGPEYRGDGEYTVVGPSAYDRRWYAVVSVKNERITKIR